MKPIVGIVNLIRRWYNNLYIFFNDIVIMTTGEIIIACRLARTIYDEAPELMPYLEKGHEKLNVERLKGKPTDRRIGICSHESEVSEHAINKPLYPFASLFVD